MVNDRVLTEASGAFALSDEDRERLHARLDLAVKRARRSGEQTLATISVELGAKVDPERCGVRFSPRGRAMVRL